MHTHSEPRPFLAIFFLNNSDFLETKIACGIGEINTNQEFKKYPKNNCKNAMNIKIFKICEKIKIKKVENKLRNCGD